MFHFDFTVPSILILLIFLTYFLCEPRLPVRKNRLFVGLVLLEIVVLLFDILSSQADMNYRNLSAFTVELLNMAYFVFFLARIFWFFLYTLDILRRFPKTVSGTMLLYAAVFLLSELITLSGFWTGAVFRIDLDGYHRGPLYNVLYVCFFFYLAVSFVLIILDRRKLSTRDLVSLTGYNVILLVGNIVRILMPQYLVMNTFCLMALMVIFISFENPAIYTMPSGSFTFSAFREYIEERVEQKDYRILGFALRNYSDAREVFGLKQMEQGVNLICKYMTETYPSLPFFYLRSGCFALAGRENLDIRKLTEEISERFRQPWVADETELYLNVAFVQMSSASGRTDAENVVESLTLTLFEIGQREATDNRLFDLDTPSILEHEVSVKRALDHAVENDSVEVFFQPMVDAKTGSLTAAEALARLRDEQGSLIPPADFIGLAEKNGKINRLGEQVLEKVCSFIRGQDMKALGLQWINVNLSPVQCMNRELCTRFLEILNRYEVPAEFVHLEITEASMLDFDMLTGQMRELQKQGFCFALDDYGSGYSNLSRLKLLPFTNIKLDLDLVQAHCKDPDPVLPTFVRLFRDKGLTITAEGIENEAMAQEMSDIGCDYLQGYYFSRPLPQEEFLAKYAPSSR